MWMCLLFYSLYSSWELFTVYSGFWVSSPLLCCSAVFSWWWYLPHGQFRTGCSVVQSLSPASFSKLNACSSIACTWSVTAVHGTHRMQLPAENAALQWWRQLTRVQSLWVKCRPSPCLLRCLGCSFAVWLVTKLLEGLQWREDGCPCLNNSPVYSPVPAQLERLAETLTCCDSLLCDALRYPRMGADSSQNPVLGWWCNPQRAVLWHVTGMDYVSWSSNRWNF